MFSVTFFCKVNSAFSTFSPYFSKEQIRILFLHRTDWMIFVFCFCVCHQMHLKLQQQAHRISEDFRYVFQGLQIPFFSASRFSADKFCLLEHHRYILNALTVATKTTASGFKSSHTALDIHKLLCTEICTKTCFCDCNNQQALMPSLSHAH